MKNNPMEIEWIDPHTPMNPGDRRSLAYPMPAFLFMRYPRFRFRPEWLGFDPIQMGVLTMISRSIAYEREQSSAATGLIERDPE
jgi:hypothetical protein